MPFVQLLLIALALSVDAFAVSVAATSTGRARGGRAAFRLAFHFGLFQFLMPVLGWAAGLAFAGLISSLDHWIAFGLLAFVGARMLRNSLRKDEEHLCGDPSRGMMLLTLSTATSIDALAVGLSLAMLGIRVWEPAIVIGVVTGTVCLGGIFLGSRLHAKFGKVAEGVGGVILFIIAFRILISHLFSA